MRIGLHLIVTGLSLVAGAALADVRHEQAPDSLRGTWAPAAESCPGPASARIVVGAKTWQSAEAACAVDWVEERAATPGVVYSFHMRCGTLDSPPASAPGSAPGRATTTNLMLWLKAPDTGDIGPSFSQLAPYRRCP